MLGPGSWRGDLTAERGRAGEKMSASFDQVPRQGALFWLRSHAVGEKTGSEIFAVDSLVAC